MLAVFIWRSLRLRTGGVARLAHLVDGSTRSSGSFSGAEQSQRTALSGALVQVLTSSRQLGPSASISKSLFRPDTAFSAAYRFATCSRALILNVR